MEIPIYISLFAGLVLILAASFNLVRKKTLTIPELFFAALGLVLVGGPTFIASVKISRDGIEVVSNLALSNSKTIEALAKKIDIVSTRVDSLLPTELKPISGTIGTVPNAKDWINGLKALSTDKKIETCLKFPYLCTQKTDGLSINDEKINDLFGDYKALNDSTSQIKILLNESNSLKSLIEAKKIGEKLG